MVAAHTTESVIAGASDPTIVLASRSPQRRQLLEAAALPVRVIPPRVDETVAAALSPRQAVVELARRKAAAVARRLDQPAWVLAADTAILLDDELIGKPPDRAAAARVLARLAGAVHQVLSGVALCPPAGGVVTELVSTAVEFAPLAVREQEWYLATGEWRGAAGGYRIQGRGGLLVARLHGSYSNVIGLPLETIYRMLARNGYRFR